MTQTPINLTRIKALAAVIAAVLLALLGRAGELQVVGWAQHAELASTVRLKSVWTSAPRGTIYDRHGRVLADNRMSWNVTIRPANFPKDPAQAEKVIQQLAGILDQPTPDVRKAIEGVRASGTAVESGPLPKMGEDVPLKVVAQIQERAYELPGVEVEEVMQRYYPGGSLACHVLGYARAINAQEFEQVRDLRIPRKVSNPSDPEAVLMEEPLYSRQAVFGKAGIEKVCELDPSTDPPTPILQGVRGRTRHEVSATGDPVGPPVDIRKPMKGGTVYLTLDARLQRIAEEALDERLDPATRSAGAAVLMDVESGDVLVLASRPGYDLNQWVRKLSQQEYKALTDDPRAPLLNHAINGMYAPASTYKIISGLAALSKTGISTATSYRCDGHIYAGTHRYGCWRRSGHGSMDFYHGLSQSCDVYYYSLIRNAGLKPEELAEYSVLFGLGSPTGIELPGESAGLVPSPKWKEHVQRAKWTLGNSYNMVIGQGELWATPLQMTVVTAAVANGGKLITPHLIKEVHRPDHQGGGVEVPERTPPKDLGIDPALLRHVQRGMRMVCTDRRGTASGTFSGFPIPVAGKTGSAEHIPGRKTHAWFVAYAPYDKPRYALTLLVSEGGHGSEVAPLAARILAAAFNVEHTAPIRESVGD